MFPGCWRRVAEEASLLGLLTHEDVALEHLGGVGIACEDVASHGIGGEGLSRLSLAEDPLRVVVARVIATDIVIDDVAVVARVIDAICVIVIDVV